MVLVLLLVAVSTVVVLNKPGERVDRCCFLEFILSNALPEEAGVAGNRAGWSFRTPSMKRVIVTPKAHMSSVLRAT